MAQKLALRDYAEDQAEALSAREFEVLQFLARGLSVKEIADALALNAKTIANHQSAIKQKLGADTSIQLLKKAMELGLASAVCQDPGGAHGNQ
jgi:two-component system, NarL family, invasion response regulator UvrY